MKPEKKPSTKAEKSGTKPVSAKKTAVPSASAPAPAPAVPAPIPAAPAAPVKTKAVRKPKATAKLEIPPILLEGDKPSAPPVSGPGKRYALGPATPPPHVSAIEDLGELPEAYGTKRLLLTARDPHWLYAHWDLTTEQLRAYNALSADKHLVLRVYAHDLTGKPVSELHVHPESRHWFAHVGRGGAKFVAQLGYYDAHGKWATISVSSATLTPPDSASDDESVRFATLPTNVSFEQIWELVKELARESIPLVEAIQQLRAEGYKGLPTVDVITKGTQWTPKQSKALAEVVTMDSVRRVWIGSLEITELLRRQLVRDVSSAGVSQFSKPAAGLAAGELSSLSSPFGGGGAARPNGFWFNINAELVIYGATEPDAEVSIGGRVIKLRPDGSFSYRFALPDGDYDLPAVAISADKTDGRAAELKFMRSTEYRGEVGAHPQDPQLKAPLVANV
jgi:hypothetical protein